MILNITPDWFEVWTKEQAEMELSFCKGGFTFNGLGWYFTPTGEALLVSDMHNNDNDTEVLYHFSYWSHSPLKSFQWICSAPVRRDNANL